MLNLALCAVCEGIPDNAKIRYADCGSHMIEFVGEASPEEEAEMRKEEARLQKIAMERILDQRKHGLIA